MTLLKLDDFTPVEQESLEKFAQKYMQDTNSITNGDTLRMGLSLKIIDEIGADSYFKNSTYIQSKIDLIQENLSSILDR